MKNNFIVSGSPHLHEGSSVKSVMWSVVAALMPALVVGVYFFGKNALLLTIYGILAAVLTEAIILFIRRMPIVIKDGSAVITGILVSFNFHSEVPWWIPVVGSVFAITIGKHVFGGLGHNIVNPALLGRVFLVASWPNLTTTGWVRTVMGSTSGFSRDIVASIPQHITSATPLTAMKTLRDPSIVETLTESGLCQSEVIEHLTSFPALNNLFWGNIGGCIGEVSAFALLLGGVYLLITRIIEWRIPFFYLGTVFVLTFLFGGINGFALSNINIALFHILSGGLMLGAFFMATDWVTSPITRKGKAIFGIGCGLFTVFIRFLGGYPEGVSYAILLMNLFVPLIDRYTFPKQFGEVKK